MQVKTATLPCICCFYPDLLSGQKASLHVSNKLCNEIGTNDSGHSCQAHSCICEVSELCIPELCKVSLLYVNMDVLAAHQSDFLADSKLVYYEEQLPIHEQISQWLHIHSLVVLQYGKICPTTTHSHTFG